MRLLVNSRPRPSHSLCAIGKHQPSRLLRIFIIASAPLFSACSLTADFKRDPQAQLLAQPYTQLEQQPSNDEPSLNWWQQFNNPQINQMIEHALAHNYELKIAAAKILEAQALLSSAYGSFLPSLGLNWRGSKDYQPALSPNNSRHNLALSMGWQLDLFGRLRHTYRAANADLSAQISDQTALTHTLIASVLHHYVGLAIAYRRLAIAKKISSSRNLTLATVERRYRRGVTRTPAVDVHLARENLLSAQANQTNLALAVKLARHALAILLGQTPRKPDPQHPRLRPLPPLSAPLTSIPLSLLDRRPDLQAAEFRSIAAQQRIGVALADLYPDLTLTGRLSNNTESLSRFLSLDNLIASIAGELATTLFQGGRLRAQVKAAKARLLAQAARYSQAAINAVREVEDALASNRLLDLRSTQIKQQLAESQRAEILAKQRYGRGIDSLLVVLETERRRQTAEDLALRVEQQRWNARINLHLALGGDWLAKQPTPLPQP